MKKTAVAILSVALALTLGACGSSTSGNSGSNSSATAAQEQTANAAVTIKQSPDKYTWYMKNYVGMNAAAVGYTSISGQRMDRYGAGYIKVVYVAKDGRYLEIEDDDVLKGYKVSAQSYEPNTEIKYTFQVDSDGKEYDNLLDFQNIEEIVLAVDKLGESGNSSDTTKIEVAPDKYTTYVRDYVGRNLRDCGYVSLAGNLADGYGASYVTFNLVTDDGAYIDLEDEESLGNYKVTGQDIEPNTPINLTFATDSDGKEYSNLVQNKTLETISLYLTEVDS